MAASSAVILERSGVDDLILLDEVSEEKVLSTLQARYLDEEIYTYIGERRGGRVCEVAAGIAWHAAGLHADCGPCWSV